MKWLATALLTDNAAAVAAVVAVAAALFQTLIANAQEIERE
jgi:hypothetical protein